MVMERKELVTKALEAGITKAHTMKSVVLEQMLSELEAPKTTGKRGRPVKEGSVRQIRLAELEIKRANGELRKGRPVKADSNRQLRLAEIEARKASGEFKLGRPVKLDSARQLRLAESEAKKAANGGVVKRGRPVKIKEITAE
jgi:hypothetical protein